MRAGIIVLRNRAEVTIDRPRGESATIPIPALPGAWSVQPQGISGWVYLEDPQGRPYWWRTVIDGADFGNPTKVVGAVFAIDAADNHRLKTFAATNERAWTLRELRADDGAAATAIRAAWRMYARDGDGNPTGPEIFASTMAGFDFPADAERFAAVDDLPDAE